ncbi:hypothetical protein Mp_Vg00560 [Marchantia polymorpha subsp. ruderalis]|uniref:Uncharacterized protein n=1 Tax=Marchantia polymorpha TaxID=3197 RepID=A0A2R6VX89_MARPO|nr:hypothetical protein MARPO_YA0061 [Marchantia polymorpha]BBN20545.1 hypothetical protein Mp_Vg00560 [Marchantia polymorpha subsp. ruderalis]|eukprot:PTQ26215.1 hypothetical protein MARPO_YA0061 [Marchantia polymorpha]
MLWTSIINGYICRYSAFRVLESSLRFTVSITISTCNGSVPNLPTIGKVAVSCRLLNITNTTQITHSDLVKLRCNPDLTF